MNVHERTDLPAVGMRIELAKAFEAFPLGMWEPGTRGTVAVSEPGRIGVRLDVHDPLLDAWNNCLMWQATGEGPSGARVAPSFWDQVVVSTARCDLPEPGTEVSLRSTFEVFPVGIWSAGERGVVAHADAESIGVRLDAHYPELDEWDNCLVWYGRNLGLGLEGMAAGFWDQVEESPAVRPGP